MLEEAAQRKDNRISWHEDMVKVDLYLSLGSNQGDRQHNIENYIVDFYIAEKKIVIEIDGIQHLSPEHKEADLLRDNLLASWGIKVIRYSNNDIRCNFHTVADDIMKNLGLDYSDLKPPH